MVVDIVSILNEFRFQAFSIQSRNSMEWLGYAFQFKTGLVL